MRQMGPYVLLIVFPKGPWPLAPSVQNPHQCRVTQQEQQQGRDLLVFLEELNHFQIGRARAVAGINLAHSRVWKQPPLKAVLDRPDMPEALLDMGTSRSKDVPGRLKIRIKCTPEVCEAASIFGTHKWCQESSEMEDFEHLGSLTEDTTGPILRSSVRVFCTGQKLT